MLGWFAGFLLDLSFCESVNNSANDRPACYVLTASHLVDCLKVVSADFNPDVRRFQGVFNEPCVLITKFHQLPSPDDVRIHFHVHLLDGLDEADTAEGQHGKESNTR